ncbi:MAG TPA: serine hydrolase [Pyrinomonadaceae bacterium]|jgi:CubicO group peptidase (beta-lactamase class C family)
MNVPRRPLNLALAAALLLSYAAAPAGRAAAQAAAKAQGAPAAAAPADLAARLAAVEKAVEERRQQLGIPGLSLAIVKDDKIVYMKGLGYRDFEGRAPVTPDTLFAIGSSSKAFTALLVAMAADAGKLSLDDSPKKFIPYFKLQDPDADARITVRDLLSHSSGLNRTDLAWVSGVLDREETIRVAATAKPTAKLREKFQYQNVMYAAAGEIVGRAEGSTWERLVAERIFGPLGMKSSNTSVPEMQKARDYSYGYVYEEATKETRRVPTRDLPAIAPAGAINSSARDMAQWVRLMLGGGAFGGRRLVSEKNFEELVRPQMKIAGSVSYGLGWFLRDWKGHKVVEHGGNIDGFNAQVALMPDQRLGFVMLTNVSASPLPASAMNTVWSNLVGDPAAPAQPAAAAAAGAAGAAAADPASKIENEVGDYRFEAAGFDVSVSVKDGKLRMAVPGQPTYTLEPQGGRRYKLAGVEGFYANFRPSKENPRETEIYLEQPHGNYTLKKVKAADATTAGASGASAEYAGPLKEVVGTYEPQKEGGPSVTVEVREGRVALVVPGQPPYPLAEREKDVLGSAALPDSYSILVRRDEAGRVAGLTLRQPGAESAFNRAAEFKSPLTVEELMAKAIQAVGGEAALRRHKTMRVVADVNLLHQGVSGEAVIVARAPAAYAQEVQLTALGKKIGSFHEFFDGAAGGDEGSFIPYNPKTGSELDEARVAADFYAPLNWKTLFRKAEIRKMAKVGDEDAYVVVFTPEKGNPVTQYISAKSFLLLRQDSFSTSDAMSMPVTETYSDYRGVDGVMIPFTRVSNSQAMGDTVLKIREAAFDVPVPDEAFRRKSAAK